MPFTGGVGQPGVVAARTREGGRLLATALRARGDKDADRLADERAAHPQAAGRVPEGLHLGAHAAIPGRHRKGCARVMYAPLLV